MAGYREKKKPIPKNGFILSVLTRVFRVSRQRETKGRELVALMLLEAGAAVDGPVVTGLERNLGGGTAVCAHGVKHFALAIAGGLPGSSAVLAADGLILEALLSVELLLASRKDEFLTAILTNQCLVFEHLCFPLR